VGAPILPAVHVDQDILMTPVTSSSPPRKPKSNCLTNTPKHSRLASSSVLGRRIGEAYPASLEP